MHHIARGQRRAAAERLEEGLRGMPAVTNAHGVDLEEVRKRTMAALTALKA
jgi:hypothetical protein